MGSGLSISSSMAVQGLPETLCLLPSFVATKSLAQERNVWPKEKALWP